MFFDDTNSRVRGTIGRAGNAGKKKCRSNVRKMIGIWMLTQLFSWRVSLI